MDFRLTKEEALFQKMCREFALNEVEPIAAEIDAEERYPEETVQKLMKYGLMGIQFPKEVGGSGGNYICYSIAIEEMSRVCGTTGGIMSAHGTLGAWPIYAFGTPEQKEKWLRPLIEPKEGAKIGAFGLTEPNAGTDSAAQQTMAVKQEDGSYIMNGSKVFITGGGRADTYVVFAMTDKTKGNKGISAFIVDKDDPGFSIGKIEHKMGIRGSQTAELIAERRRTTDRRSKSSILTAEDIDLPLLETAARGDIPKTLMLVYETSGSTPVKSGSYMVVDANTATAGTIGGGCSESAVMRQAYYLIGTGEHKCVTIDMSNDIAAQEGMVCGGQMKVLLADLGTKKST